MNTENAVDVVMLTKNSESILRECLTSIYENVPVNRLIVLDASSTDNTSAIIEEFDNRYGNVVFITENGSRAEARERGIKEVETEWFMFVDSDVILCKNWFKKAIRHINDKVGAVWGLNFDITPNTKNRFFLKLLAILAEKCFNIRGGMHDTLIRREALEDIHIPEWLHAYEDAYIINWIREKGYHVIIGDDLYCLHYRPNRYYTLRESVSAAVTEVKCGLVYSHLYRYTFYYPLLTFNWMIQALYKNFKGI
ncbi:glycosyltransferase family 2 protein [Candidatus Bathyarchaeota archaeon]|nr:glycosyltransferase family 2 protein [Candidatus Bathyarchaeota archaeon]